MKKQYVAPEGEMINFAARENLALQWDTFVQRSLNASGASVSVEEIPFPGDNPEGDF